VLQKRGELEAAAAAAVLRALAAPAAAGGDVLAFLPGVAEIRRLQRLLQPEAAVRARGVLVQELHGGLAPQRQDAVIRCAAVTGGCSGCRCLPPPPAASRRWAQPPLLLHTLHRTAQAAPR
jgi:hypothetical protein